MGHLLILNINKTSALNSCWDKVYVRSEQWFSKKMDVLLSQESKQVDLYTSTGHIISTPKLKFFSIVREMSVREVIPPISAVKSSLMYNLQSL